ncbi:MAG: CpsD/CapB family tyrosine-protein kinase [Chloroflexi bacterium]|nr:CpsD/CapB family tyrosine-protein kinase [Chloroflexota bacterium]
MTLPLIALTHPQSPAAEAYRALRTNLEFARPDAPIRLVVFTSPSRAEDTADVVANLAVTVAQTGRRVLAVDADLRRPRLHDLFQVPDHPGLTEMVEAREQGESYGRETVVPGLWVLPAGHIPSNPADILDSKWLTDVWPGLRSAFDMVLINTPPVLAVADAAILAPRVDGVVLVLKAGTTKRSHALQAKERLERVGALLLGTVLVDAPYDKAVQSY